MFVQTQIMGLQILFIVVLQSAQVTRKDD